MSDLAVITETNLEELFNQTQCLPSIPKVVQELIGSFNDEDVSVDYLASRIACDQVLSARLLRMANSPGFLVPRTIASVSDAMAVLGFVNVRTLIISIALTGSFRNIPGVDLGQFWQHSLHTAVASRHLAKPAGLSAELAFIIGLMHNIGQLVMYLAMPEVMQTIEVPLLDPQRAVFERKMLGYCSADVGAELARHWNFPAVFSSVIAGVANPLACSNPLAALIHIVAWRSQVEGLSAAEREAVWPDEVAASIALPASLLLQDFPSWDELCEGMQGLVS